MSIEIVERPTCPTCGGNKHVRTQSFTGTNGEMGTGNPSIGPCITCHGDGTVPRVLATFADAAEMIEKASWAETIELGRVGPVVARAVLAALGVSDDQG